MSEFTLRQLEYFVAIADHGSVTAAAQARHVSQGAVSMAVAQLEKALGVELLLRTRSKRVVPTAAGEELIGRARHLMALSLDLRDAVRSGVEEMRGPLRIGVSATISPRTIPPLLEYFVTNYPQVDVDFSELYPDELQEAVAHGALDFGLVYAMQAHPDLYGVTLGGTPLHLMFAASHRFAGDQEVWLKDVIDEPLVLLDIPPTVERVRALIQSLGLEPRLRWTSSSMETIRSLVGRGLCYSFVNTVPSTRTTSDDLPISYVPIADKLPFNPIKAVLAPGATPPRRVKAALEFLRRHLGGEDNGQLPA